MQEERFLRGQRLFSKLSGGAVMVQAASRCRCGQNQKVMRFRSGDPLVKSSSRWLQLLLLSELLTLGSGLFPLAAQAQEAAPPSRIRPGWGFDWRHPDRSSCREITPAVLPYCSRCKEVPNAYGSGIDAQSCYLVPKFEYMIFPTAEGCETGLQMFKSKGGR